MRLFLASQDLGAHAETLRKMVGEKRQALVISNARDYYNDESRIASSVEKTLVNLDRIGIKASRIDLKPYFNKPSELESLIRQSDVGLIFSIGGNVICLATALHASGMDEIIRNGVAADQFVYGGYSAGAMIATYDLSPYRLKPQPNQEPHPSTIFDITQTIYNLPPYEQGLGLISEYITPHMDRPDHIDAMNERLNNISQIGGKAIRLNDPEVYVVDGNTKEIL